MPARNILKQYLSDSIYHIYNRGVEKRIIFIDNQDYKVFLSYIEEYLTPLQQGSTLLYRELTGKYYGEIILLAFCLMPNHFHLLIKQKDKDSIKRFSKSLFTRYSMYFNKKYKRVGPLFQSIYKATNVIDKEHLLYISKYIHLNPSEKANKLIDAYSSYSDYLGITNTQWLNKFIVLTEFNKSSYMKYHKIKTYKQFVEEYKEDLPQYTLGE
ncbi:hypothetical protein A2130_00715 [Candidatus Woesebacteria bacterium GWC2_33_12]|uniref:Transposase IS200-like domain-containing protein n=1 Tax=Candidatus Woesebacteria bacterium GW2011_GWB1_33_22 TaxID=1618566 RepID=A0A0G0A269_9BACT|nr:MAG: hypothetical protein UR29_C0002G0036 [Candidatus Woesebacteria bacterium GW2011_GWC2_33_12]KKP42508.1 MAG: hypothetical protein UR33_C0002G0084 [Candidatus Woesebacteria bacterium GW2011_GWA2_33_20]KKP45251.1 MAG: hypothetical protein UR35_C0002G0084 [Candidatus Woesebacteria bacterium GW2011_GWB1_33_22]KKP46454.1 MAG: hypothetical protein UR37_C0007G0011 [Microgenomates group bacterium GW2011_GWC1_33_28]KKP50921.1 MAG: hypothetical protein UR41_C0002G0085 [Candidatus Woesebacteria bact